MLNSNNQLTISTKNTVIPVIITYRVLADGECAIYELASIRDCYIDSLHIQNLSTLKLLMSCGAKTIR